MNTNIILNYSKLRLSSFFIPLFLLTAIMLFLYCHNAMTVNSYIEIQKKSFYTINYYLGHYPKLEYNLTQFGDAMIFLSFLSSLFVFAPKVWESLLSGLLVSLIFSCVLKKAFAVPRPAAVFNNNSFYIVGKAVCGHNSLPSGHSITIFTILSVLLYGFMPKKLSYKFIWSFFIVIMGLILIFTRVGVGAHYPIDVITGGIIGYIAGLSGIFINRKYKIWTWINDKKYYPIFMLLFLGCCISLICRILSENLLIFYYALICVAVSLFLIIYIYVKK
ncbi:phosphatase PAP2 family protein [Flavobacterium sp. B11]|uniref:phosphatase PAP2 family protein n=1 Tax=Flavobacterium movens TaxID=214860 RepID=UPI0031CE5158